MLCNQVHVSEHSLKLYVCPDCSEEQCLCRPAAFETKPSKAEVAAAPEGDSDSDNSSDGDRSPLQPNNNRPNISYFDLEDSDSETEGNEQ